MTEYLLSVTAIVILSTILSNILPSGKTAGVVKGIFRLCVYLVILSPVVVFINTYSTKNEHFFEKYFDERVIKTSDVYIEYCSEKTVAEAERLIEEKLKEDYSIATCVTVIVSETTDKILKVEKIVIEVNDISSEKQTEIEQDFKRMFSVDIQFTKGG